MEVEKVNIWLDCDVGNDDAMAIILALYHPKSNLLGISTCFGNTCLENCTNNTIRLLSSVGRSEVPVFKGAACSLKSVTATTKMHGNQGLYAAEKLIKNFEPVQNIPLYDLIKNCWGLEVRDSNNWPINEYSNFIEGSPRDHSLNSRDCFYGGTSGFGNVTPNSEYNVYSDPEAAQFVIDTCKQHQLKLVMIALDLTYTCQLVESLQQRIKAINTKFSDWCLEMLQEFQAAYKAQEFDYPPIHDRNIQLNFYNSCCCFYPLHPELYITKPLFVAVDCESKLCYGRTVVDKQGVLGLEPTLEFGRKVVVEEFWNQMIEAIRQAAKNSKLE